jgi:hypothetical protein
MAFGTKNVWVSRDAKDLQPTGSVIPTTRADIGNLDIKRQNLKINSILASASANANKVTAFDDLLNTEVVAFLDNLIDVDMAVDVAGQTVDYNFNVTKISRGLEANDFLLDEATDVFVVEGQLEVAVS